MLFVCHPKIVHKHCLQFLLGVKMVRRETENNAYAKFWGDKQRTLWYVMVFSGVANCLAVPVLKKLKIWSFHVVVLQRRQRNVQKSVVHVQRCRFAD